MVTIHRDRSCVLLCNAAVGWHACRHSCSEHAMHAVTKLPPSAFACSTASESHTCMRICGAADPALHVQNKQNIASACSSTSTSSGFANSSILLNACEGFLSNSELNSGDSGSSPEQITVRPAHARCMVQLQS